MKRALTAAGAAVLLAGPAAAQLEPIQGSDPVVEELVVAPPTPGPAWWRVVDEDSIVYIMIGPEDMPTNLGLDRSTMDFRMNGASRLITPFDLSLVNPKSLVGMGAMLVQAPKLLGAGRPAKPPKGQAPLEARLPEPAREKFVALRTRIGQPAERYAAMTPMEAVGRLERDYRAYLKLGGVDGISSGPVQEQMEGLAKANRVPIEVAYKITVPAAKLKIETFQETKPPKVYDCVVKAIDQMTARGESEVRAARAWAQGDVRPLLRPARFEADPECRANSAAATVSAIGPKASKMEEDYVRGQVAAIERAMKRPGHSVAVLMPLSPLGRAEWGMLGTKGVLAQLKAKGYEIRTPASLN